MKTKIKSKLALIGKLMSKVHQNWFALILITIVMLLMSWCSPIYRFAYDAVDMNVSWAISKAIYHGQVYFRDIFEQRGIYFYLLQPFTAFLPYYWAKTCIWVLEVANMYGLYLIFAKTFLLVLGKNKKRTAYWYAIFLTGILPFTPVMSNLGAPEEFSLMPISYVGYLYAKFTKTHDLTWKNNLLLGILFGYVINVKYSVSGAIVGFYLGYGFYLLFKKEFKKFFQTVGVAFGGLAIGEIPALIYFGANNALGNYFKRYFFDNASSFNLSFVLQSIFVVLFTGSILTLLLIFPFYIFLSKTHKQDRASFRIAMFIFAGTLFGLIAIGRSGVAYALPLTIVIFSFCGPYLWAVKYYRKPVMSALLVLASIGMLYSVVSIIKVGGGFTAIAYMRTPSLSYYRKNNTKGPEYKLSRMIGNYGGGNIMTLSSISSNEFNFNKEYPRLFYFDQTAMSFKQYPYSVYGQLRYVRQSKPDWIVYSDGQLAVSNNTTKQQIQNANKRWHRQIKFTKAVNYASVTAYDTYLKKYPNKAKVFQIQQMYRGNYRFVVQYKFYKPLLKNYVPVFCGITLDTGFKNHPVQQVNYHWLFAKKSLLKKYPSLQKKVIDLDQPKPSQFIFEYDMH